jgi:hypothetical protein
MRRFLKDPRMGKVFICYRRIPDEGFAGRIFDTLGSALGPERVFMDIDSIPKGANFKQIIKQAIEKCTVAIVVIGRNWANTISRSVDHRLGDPDDFVRVEVELAMQLGKHIIPVLLGNVDMPGADELPESLKEFSFLNAANLRHDHFKSDAQDLVRQVDIRAPRTIMRF